jgi:hypothetical protein
VTGTTTTGGGRWTVQWWGPHISTTLRAVWKDNASAPVTVWKRATVYLRKSSRGRFLTGAWGGGGVFWRKHVLVQRRAQGAWKTVKKVVLTDSGGRTYFRLSVPKGSLLRAVLPTAQAKPCFVQGVSPTLRT